MKLIYSGFDTLDIAFRGALPIDSLSALNAAKLEAVEHQASSLAKAGPGNVSIHVHPRGQRGGYALCCDTGPTGEIWAFKENSDPTQWNIFVSIRSATFAALGFKDACNQVWKRLSDLGCTITGHSINRADYAMDFQIKNFALELDCFVAHPRTTIRPYWGTDPSTENIGSVGAVLRGRRLESVTLGKMPGRQVIVYDKRREVISKRKCYWFDIWEVDRSDKEAGIWRIEIRAGKQELKERKRIRTLENLTARFFRFCQDAVRDIRYTLPAQSDSNVSRQTLHPIWLAVREHLESSHFQLHGRVSAELISFKEREECAETYLSLILGNSIGYGVSIGLSDDDILRSLPAIIRAKMKVAFGKTNPKLLKSIQRSRERLHFISDLSRTP